MMKDVLLELAGGAAEIEVAVSSEVSIPGIRNPKLLQEGKGNLRPYSSLCPHSSRNPATCDEFECFC